MNTTTHAKTTGLWATAALVALVGAIMLSCAAFAPAAYANRQLDAPTAVSDDITRVHVNKLDADTHEYVEGASMAIIEKDTGKVVDEWVTGSSTHATEKALNVGTVYILREVKAPKGYDKVKDTEFVINEIEGEDITILSGPGELTESYRVNLYDKAQPVEKEIVVEKTRPGSPAPKTGDETPLSLVVTLVVVAILAIGILEFSKRRIKD